MNESIDLHVGATMAHGRVADCGEGKWFRRNRRAVSEAVKTRVGGGVETAAYVALLHGVHYDFSGVTRQLGAALVAAAGGRR